MILAKKMLSTMVYNFSSSLASSLFFSYGVIVNSTSPTEHSFYLSQDGGTSLPSNDYYKDVNTTNSFLAHVSQMFLLAGFNISLSSKMAYDVYNFEYKLSNIQLPPDQMRDPIKTYNPTKAIDLALLCPHFDWNSLFSAFPVLINDVILDNPDYFASLSTILASTTVDTLKV